MKKIVLALYSVFLVPAVGGAQSPVTIQVQDRAIAKPNSSDFAGLSFETGTLQFSAPEHPALGAGGVNGYLWDLGNTQLLTLIRNLRIRSLRIGGDSVDDGHTPTQKEIDILFHFAEEAHVKVIYSVRMKNGNIKDDTEAVKYIWHHYRRDVTAFSIGNEPNWYNRHNAYPPIHDPASSFAAWKQFAKAIEATVPGVPLGGPDTGHSGNHVENSGSGFSAYFVQHQAEVGNVRYLYAHDYVGKGEGSAANPAQKLIDAMLSPEWDTVNNPENYQNVGVLAASVNLPYRFTEFNNFVAPMPGTMGGNNAFAGALFAVDAMHWWAAHGCDGVNFHTVIGKYNGTVYRDTNGNFQVYPVGYGILAFGIGGNGTEHAVTVANPQNLDLTAYAVKDRNSTFYVTVVNKEHGSGAHSALVEIELPSQMKRAKAAMMMLQAPGNDVSAITGITLGGSVIANNAAWSGKWSPVNKKGPWTITVPVTSAAIVRFIAK